MKKKGDEMSCQLIKESLEVAGEKYQFYNINQLQTLNKRMPFIVKIILESLIRNHHLEAVSHEAIHTLSQWSTKSKKEDIHFFPGRVILQDFTGVPCVVDLAAMRQAMVSLGGNPDLINPQVPCSLVIDHSVQVDSFAHKNALQNNIDMEFKRNRERYEFLKWGSKNFKNFKIVPPAMGIVHQVNLEYLATVVLEKEEQGERLIYSDSVVGTDSHTTMINGMSVLGWGVGGIEAESVMLGQPISILTPEVVGVHLHGKVREGATGTDVVLTITEKLRKVGVVGKFVEFFGKGMSQMGVPDRATIANMAPEYGATSGFFPVDEKTIDFLKNTGRLEELCQLVEAYTKKQGLFYDDTQEIEYNQVVDFDLAEVVVSVAGPKRPQDRVSLENVVDNFNFHLKKPIEEGGFLKKGLSREERLKKNKEGLLDDGSIVLASITSCTNTSNPYLLIMAGLLAKSAVQKGLQVKPFVKTSLAPGSRVVTEYLKKSNLLLFLEKLGFHVVGYGCTSCIGNSGPLPEKVAKEVKEKDIVSCAVISGNRNFEGRVNPLVKANYLASPPLVVAYALAGSCDVNLLEDEIGEGGNGEKVFLKDIWPESEEVNKYLSIALDKEDFKNNYKTVLEGDDNWKMIEAESQMIYKFKKESQYLKYPPFFEGMTKDVNREVNSIENAQVLLYLGDSITTDHISPAGAIAEDSPAGKYLKERGTLEKDFNTYGARRGHDEVMVRGTFANIRLRNKLAKGKEGGWTQVFPSQEVTTIYEASCTYKKENKNLIILAGKEYGTGSSRDWAAKGTALLGVKAIIAESYERIHRSNLIGMGVLPLQFSAGESGESLGLQGNEKYSIIIENSNLSINQKVKVIAEKEEGEQIFYVKSRLDTESEIDYYINGGILKYVLRKII